MSATIDQRIVEMRFDNKHFEQNVSTTMSSLEKLKQSLNFTGATKGLDSLSVAAGNVNMSGLGNAVENVRARFSALEVMGVTALANITNSAVNTGKQMLSALTIDPIKTGLQEYETQINSVQTILANTSSKGTTLDDVNAALDELNKYADQTIYNFTEMTRNIGTFTAAGVDLDKSVSAIKGIANLAAVSGSTSQQASTAMYQLSQALATGTVKLQDWNSVVNAGMGGEVFQNALVRTAAAMDGAAANVEAWRKKNIDSFGSFRDSLTEGGWLTTDVLTKTLEQFTMSAKEGTKEWEAYKKSLLDQGYTDKQVEEILKMANTATDAATKVKTFTQLWDVLKESAQSGWTQTWEIVIGDFEEAKSLLTPLADTLTGFINKMSDARNNLLEGALSFASPWTSIMDKLDSSGFGGIKKVVDTIDNATDKLSEFQEAVDRVWKGEFGTSDTGRYNLLEKAGYDPRVIQDLVNKGSGYKITVEDIEASHKKFGITMSETSDEVSKMSDVMANLSDEQLKAAGLTDEEIKLYKDLAAEAERTGVSISDLAKKMSENDGRTILIESFKNAGSGLVGVFTALKEAWAEIFPPPTVIQIYNIIEAIHKFSENLRLTDKETGKLTATAEKIKRTFKGVFAVVDIARQVFVGVVKAIAPLFGCVRDLGGGVLGLTASWGDWLVHLNDTIKKTGVINTIFDGISKFLQNVISNIKEFSGFLKEKFAAPGLEALESLLDRVSERFGKIGEASDGSKSIVVSSIEAMSNALANCQFFKLMRTLWDGVKRIGSGLASVFGALTEGLIDKIGNADFSGLFDFINSLSLGGIAVFVAKFVKGFSDITDSIGSFKESAIGILDSVKDTFEAYQSQLKAEVLLKIASAIAILAAAILVISLIDSKKLSASLGAITVLFADLMGSMAIFGKIGGTFKGIVKACAAMEAMAVAILILALALKAVGSLDVGQMVTGLVGIIGLTGTLVAATIILSKFSKGAIKGATQMVIFAAAIKILASACTDLSSLSWSELTKGLVGVGVLLAEVSLFMNTAKFSGKSITTAAGVVILSSALKILASVCSDFGQMKWGEIGKGLTAIGALLLELAVFTRLTGNAKHVISTGVALVAIGASMKIFASAVKDMSGMTWEELTKGLLSMAGALLAVTLAVNFMPKNIAGIGVGLVIVSAALITLAKALKDMGGMEWSEICKGLVALGGSILILALGLKFMTGALAGSAALIVAATAIAILTPSLKALGDMSVGEIVKSLITIAGAFVILGAAGAILGPLVPAILGLAGSFALIGLSVLTVGAGLALAGVGLSALAIGFTALATSVTTGATAIVAGLTVIITGLISLIPAVITKIGEGFIALCGVIAEGAPAIGEAVKAVVLTLIDVLIECVPAIAEGALQLIVGVLAALVQYTPQITGYLFDFFIGALDSLAEHIPELIQKGVDVIMAVFTGVIDALKGMDVSTLVKGIAGVGLMAGIMLALSSVAALIPGAMIGILGIGAVIAEMALVLGAIGLLAQLPGLDWLINEGGQLLGSIGKAIGSFIGGIIGGVMSGIASGLPEIGTYLSEFMINATPFIAGLKMIDDSMLESVAVLAAAILALTAAELIAGVASFISGGLSFAELGTQLSQFMINAMPFIVSAKLIDPAVMEGVKSLAEIILILTAADILNGLTSWFTGGSSLVSFGEQLPQLGTYIASFANNLGTFDESKVESITCAANAIKAIAQAANELPNEGGWAAKILGDNSIATFGSYLPGLGSNLNQFAANLGVWDEAKVATVTCAANAIKALAKAAEEIPNEGGWAAKIFGDNSLATFGEQLAGLGSNLSTFAKNLGTFDDSKVSTVNAAVKAINALAKLADSDLNGAKKNMEGFGDKLPGLAKDVSSFCSDMPSSESITNAIKSIKDVMSMIKDISSVDASAVSDFTKSLKNIGKDGVKSFVDAFTNGTTKADVKKAGTELIKQVIDGAESKEEDLKTTFTDAVKACADKIKSKTNYDKFKSAGSYLVGGFAQGIKDNKSKATAEAQAMVDAVESIVREGLAINSPSKVFIDIGSSIPEGFALGIEKMSKVVSSSSIGMSDIAIAGVKDSLSRISDAINSDVDTQPTIRPVIDMSDVETKANAINHMFNNDTAFGVTAKVDAISTTMNSRQNGFSNADVVSAIDKLGNHLDNARGDTYNIEGITYDDGSAVSEAMKVIVRKAITERRV